MTSRYLTRLDAEISCVADRVQCQCLLAERAMYLARIGSTESARRDIMAIQASNSETPNAYISAWANTAQAVLSHTLGEENDAYDRFRRARAIAIAANVWRIERISAAWLAYIEYTRTNTESMVQFVNEALRTAPAIDPIAHARASLVVGQAFHLADRYDLAAPWYSAARGYAVEMGDELLTSALIHNAAWLHVANQRQRTLTCQDHGTNVNKLVLAADSASNFDSMIGVSSQESFVPLLRASAYLLEGLFSNACDLYNEYIDLGKSQGLLRMSACLYADRAYCKASLGDIVGALDDVSRAVSHSASTDHLDDQASKHSRIAQVLSIAGRIEESRMHRGIADGLWLQHRAFQDRLLEKLAGIHCGEP